MSACQRGHDCNTPSTSTQGDADKGSDRRGRNWELDEAGEGQLATIAFDDNINCLFIEKLLIFIIIFFKVNLCYVHVFCAHTSTCYTIKMSLLLNA